MKEKKPQQINFQYIDINSATTFFSVLILGLADFNNSDITERSKDRHSVAQFHFGLLLFNFRSIFKHSAVPYKSSSTLAILYNYQLKKDGRTVTSWIRVFYYFSLLECKMQLKIVFVR